MNVTAAAAFECIIVRIDGIMHLWMERPIGVRAYIDDNGSMFGIVFVLNGGVLEVEYDTREKWMAVLAAVEPLLIGGKS